MKSLPIVVLAAALLSATTLPCQAGPNANAKILIHLTRVDKVTCDHSHPTCADIVTKGDFNYYYYCPLLVMDADPTAGVAEVSCGLDYVMGLDGLYVGWVLCADSQVGTAGPHGPWPAPGSGNRVSWNAGTHCQRTENGGPGSGVVAEAGYFYIAPYDAPPSSPRFLAVTTNPADGLASVKDCSGNSEVVEGGSIHRNPSHLGYVTFSNNNMSGYNPCGQNTPSKPSTWSGVKSLISSGR